MGKLFRKLYILGLLIAGAFDNWRTDIWPRDLDARYCCDGRECGCGGATTWEIYGGRHDR